MKVNNFFAGDVDMRHRKPNRVRCQRRTSKLAFTLTLLGGTVAAFHGATGALSAAEAPPTAAAESCPIPYPFAESQPRLTPAMLVNWLGLQAKAGNPTPHSAVTAAALPAANPRPIADLPPPLPNLKPVLPATSVVTASANEPLVADEPSAQETPKAVVKPAAPEPTAVSLIDVELPFDGVEPQEPAHPTLLNLTDRDDSSAPAAAASEPAGAHPLGLPAGIELPRLASSANARQPEIVSNSGKMLSLRIEAPQLKSKPAAEAAAPQSTRNTAQPTTLIPTGPSIVEPAADYTVVEPSETEFRLSDSGPQESSQPKPAAALANSLHSSSASQTPPKLVTIPRDPIQPTQSLQIHLDDTLVASDAKPLAARPQPVVQMAHSFESFTFSDADETQQPTTSANSRPHTQAQPASANIAKQTPLKQEIVNGPAAFVKVQDATTIVCESPIAELSVEDPSICQIIQTGKNTFSLVGVASGSTRIALITQVTADQRTVEIREVSVGSEAATESGRLTALAEDITQTVKKLYPDSRVTVQAVDGNLIVRGTIRSEAEARKLLAFVRKTSLKPVVDQLQSN